MTILSFPGMVEILSAYLLFLNFSVCNRELHHVLIFQFGNDVSVRLADGLAELAEVRCVESRWFVPILQDSVLPGFRFGNPVGRAHLVPLVAGFNQLLRVSRM